MSKRSRYEHSLLDLCGRIHGAWTGSGEGIPDEEAQALLEWLTWRLNEGWEVRDYAWVWIPFDAAVKDLCAAALKELEMNLASAVPVERSALEKSE